MNKTKTKIPKNFISVPLKINGEIPPKPEGNNFKCDVGCNQVFKSWDELAWHITTEHNKNYKKNPKEFLRLN